MSAVKVEQLTKAYGPNKGIFGVSFTINRGEVFGFLGPNGAGKTTTIRHLLGFTKPQSGKAAILELDCWTKPQIIQRHLGYLPAEIAFPEKMTGMQLISYFAGMRKLRNTEKAEELIQRFSLDPSGRIDRMSKGTKQKLGIVCAFMHNPDILILDEPTTGLDPIMQSAFVELIREEKKAGKSILMSSHLFEEIEGTCDRIGMIKEGRLVSMVDADAMRNAAKKTYAIEFASYDDWESMKEEGFTMISNDSEHRRVVVEIEAAAINELLRALSTRNVSSVDEVKSSLEAHFLGLYKGAYRDVQ